MDYHLIFLVLIGLGLLKIVVDSYTNIREGRYSLDYIAFLAMVLSLFVGEYGAGAVVACMFIGGEFLETFATRRAQKTLQALSDTIPKECVVEDAPEVFREVPIQQVKEGAVILVKRGEIAPLDGVLVSEEAVCNLANLTGESESITFRRGTFIKSGAQNAGESIRLRVVGDFSSSTYQKIVGLVENAKLHPARTVRLSEKANFYFTALTFVIAGVAYALTGDLVRLLAVLVIATPCPLIIAAPVAFVSGMSRLARSGIIMRKPAAFEGIDAATTVFFDKTGTLTLGEPVLVNGDSLSPQALAYAAGLEIHSLHPRARSIVHEAEKRNIHFVVSQDVTEELGKGISGTIEGKRYALLGSSLLENEKEIACLEFRDILKEGAFGLLRTLERRGVRPVIITGDSTENAKKIFGEATLPVYAEQSPEHKFHLIEEEKKKGGIVVMVGDGLNDAPALARADVGVVFSGTENGASIQAADVAVLGSGLEKLEELFSASRHTMRIARQSIYGGIALSVVGMSIAAFGYITPVKGALIQELIDVIVIVNALRALGRW